MSATAPAAPVAHPDTGPRPGPAPRRGSSRPLSLKLARGRAASLAAVAVAVLGGSALVTVGGVVADTGVRSVVPADRLAGTDVVVAAPQNLDVPEDLDIALPERAPVPEAVVAGLAALPEVGLAVGDVGFQAAVLGEDGPVAGADPRTAGHGWASASLPGGGALTGEPPRGPGEVVLDRAAAEAAGAVVGGEVRLVAGGQVSAYRLTGILDTAAPSILVDDATAADLAGRSDGPRAGTVDLVGLHAAEGVTAAELRSAVEASAVFAEHDLVALSGDRRGDAESPGVASARSMLVAMAGSLSGIILLVIGFTVAGALSVSVAAQRRDLALLRAVGATPLQIRRLVALPNMLVTALTLPFGIAAGYLLGDGALRGLVATGMMPEGLPAVLGPVPGLAAAALTLLAVWLACRGATRRIAGAAPVDALAESVAEPRAPGRVRTWSGAVLLAASTAVSVPALVTDATEAVAGAALASLVAAIGLALAGPALVRRVSGFAARRLPSRVSPLTWLAVQNLHGHSVRVAGAASALAMTVAFTLGQSYAQTSLSAAGDAQRAAGERADLVVSAPGLGGVPSGLAEEVRRSPAVEEAVTSTPTAVVGTGSLDMDLPGEDPETTYLEATAQVVGPGADRVLDLDVVEGDLGRLTGETVAVSVSAARYFGTGLGETFTFRAGDGARISAEVVAVYRRDLGYGWVTLPSDLARGHVTGDVDARLLVLAAPGQEDEARRVLEAAAADYPGVGVEEAGAAQEGGRGLDANAVLNLVVLLALVGYMVLSVANRLSAQTLQRQGEVDALRAIGMTPGQTRSVLRREAAMIALGANAAGLLAVLFPLFCVGVGLLGRPFPAGPFWLVPVTVLSVSVVAWLCVAVPARRLTTDPSRR
ncbi:FtsX-like permease family protein [Nocardiopsis sp. NPDC058631]|uniref:ABC transporter permease n=1 Tax=Nocardiopsis sp. NPDC058631 TaxID=3346566 RepID=UPI003668953E